MRRNLAQFTGRCRARQTRRSWNHDGRTDCLEGQAIIDDFIECEGSLAARSRACGLHVRWWRLRVTNSACVTCRRRFSISMLRKNELRQVHHMPIKIAMECHGNKVRTGGYLTSPTQMQARRARALSVLLDRHGSTPLRRSHQGRGCRSNATDISMSEGSVLRRGSRPNSNGDAKEESRRLNSAQTSGGISVEDSTEEHRQAKNLWSLREEFMAESPKTLSAMTTSAKVDDDRLIIHGQTLTTS